MHFDDFSAIHLPFVQYFTQNLSVYVPSGLPETSLISHFVTKCQTRTNNTLISLSARNSYNFTNYTLLNQTDINICGNYTSYLGFGPFLANDTLIKYNASIIFNSFNVIFIEIYYWFIIYLCLFIQATWSSRETLSKICRNLKYKVLLNYNKWRNRRWYSLD